MADRLTPKTITATEASNKFGSLIDEASRGRSLFVITRRGLARAVLLGMDQYRALLEELEITQEQNDPAFQAALAEAKQDYELGRVMNQDEFDAEFGFSEEMLLGDETDSA